MLPFLRDLLAHAAWADAAFFQAWAASPAREHEELRRRVGHVVEVQHFFLALLRGELGDEPPPDTPLKSFAELKAWSRATHAAWRDYLAGLDEAAPARKVRVVWFPDPPCVITVAEAVVQVAMHTQHHRGQLMTRLKDHGGQPLDVDWVVWLWRQKPPAAWE